jgi:uncharacterized protein YndB with AHSA1/START domain
MTQVRFTEHFEAPIEHVFELGIEAKRFPEWAPMVYAVKDVSIPFGPVGSSYIAVMKLLGRPIESRVEVTTYERPKLFITVGTSPEGVKFTWMIRLTPAVTGTDLEFLVDYELPVGFFGELFDELYIEKAIARDLKYSIERFKALVEIKVPTLV